MAHEDRHAHGRARDPQIREVEDLARLGDDLPLLLRVAVLEEHVDLGERVEGDGVRIDARLLRLAGDVGADLRARARRSPCCPVPETAWYVSTTTRSRPTASRSAMSGGTSCIVLQFGLAMMPSWASRSAGLTWLTTSGMPVLHPPGARVVDDGAAASRGVRRQVSRGSAAGGEEGEVDAVERFRGRLLDLDLPPVEREGRPSRARRGQEADLPDREAPLQEDRGHHAADDAGGADDGDTEVIGEVSGHGSAFRARRDRRAPLEYSSAPGLARGRCSFSSIRPRAAGVRATPWPGGAASRPCGRG